MIMMVTLTLQARPAEKANSIMVKIEKYNTSTIGLRLANLQKKNTIIKVVDFSTKVWISDYIKNEIGYAKRVNLKGLPAGEYLLQIENNGQYFVQAFYKNDFDFDFFQAPNKIQQKGTEAILASVSSSKKKGKVISRFTSPGIQSVGVQLANLASQKTVIQLNQVFSNKILAVRVNGENGFAKKFNLEGMAYGDYYFIIKVGKMVQLQFFSYNPNGIQMKEQQVIQHFIPKTKMAAK